MRNTQEIKSFISKWKNFTSPTAEILYDYKPICTNLLYEEEDLVLQVIDILKKNITKWSQVHSKIYKHKKQFITQKYHLKNKENWYVKTLLDESAPMKSSGSTTGNRFEYLRWEPFLHFIECYNHYDLIMDEYDMPEKPNVLFWLNSSYHDSKLLISKSANNHNFLENHGIKRKAVVHNVNVYLEKKYEKEFMPALLNYIDSNNIDVILTCGPKINDLCIFLKEKKYNKKICKLMSNTNEKLLEKDKTFLLGNNYVDNICDHMRCWDGGATFFSCKKNTLHLLDNLSWCEEKDNKLISTDYFSLPSPFVNYWNGDRCKLSNEYKKCRCGRLYREFIFLENRPFAIKGNSFNEYKQKLLACKIYSIERVSYGFETIEIVSKKELNSIEKQKILSIFNKQKVIFKVSS